MLTAVPNAAMFIQVGSLGTERYCVKKAELVVKTADRHVSNKSVPSLTKFTVTCTRNVVCETSTRVI